MHEFKDSRHSYVLLLIGLCILLASVVVSIHAIDHLEKVYLIRHNTGLLRSDYGELSGRLKDREIDLMSFDQNQFEQKSEERKKKEADNEEAIKNLHKKIFFKAIDDEELKDLVINLNDDLNQLLHGPDKPDKVLLEKIIKLLERMNHIKNTTLGRHNDEVLSFIKRLMLIANGSIFLGILLIIFAIYLKKRSDRNGRQVIEELTNLKNDAESASLLKSKFLSTVSHEIRTPLNGIIGLSDLLVKNNGPKDSQSLAKTINESGKTLLRIINDILDFSKIESGRLELEEVDFSIPDVLDKIMMTLSPKASEKSLYLNYEMNPELPETVKGDPDRISQVLYNLLGNAIKFTHFGSVLLRIKVVGHQNQAKLIEFSVEDTGIGIDQDQMKNLFQPFVQFCKIGTSGEEGTGLGLSIAKSIVKAMGGTMNVESRLGHGSNFSFIIPFKAYSLTKSGKRTVFINSKKQDTLNKIIPLKRNYIPKILLVEDNPTNQIVTQEILKRLQVDSVLASNGLEALDFLKNEEYDLILMDCQMPVMDGIEATQLIRGLGILTPIVALTANAYNEDQDKCLHCGMNDYLSKPFQLDDLKVVIDKHLPFEKQGTHDVQAQTNIFDQNVIEILDGSVGTESRKLIVKTFCHQLNKFNTDFIKGVENGDLETIHFLAHKLKGSSLTVGGVAFYQNCQLLEKEDSIEKIASMKQQILESSNTLVEKLKAFI